MASRDRALNYAVRVKGQQEAVAAFRTVGQAASQSIDAIAAASAAAGAHDEAVARATNSAAAFGLAQADATRKMAEAKAALAAGTSNAEQYQRAVADAKSGLSVFKAENQAAARAVDATARTLVAAQQAAADYGRQLAAAKAAGSGPVAPGAVAPDLRSGAARVIAGDASVDRAAISATTLEQVLGRVATRGQQVTAAMTAAAQAEREAATAQDAQAATADRLRARYNPLYAVISNYLTTVREIRQAEASGAISADERTQALQRERQATLGAIAAIKTQTAAARGLSGAQRAGLTNIGFQINDVTTQLSAGTPLMQVFAQQSGQVVGGLAMVAKEGSTMASVLGGPWGLAVITGVSLLGLLGSKLFETGHSVDDLVDKMKKDEKQSEASRAAKALYQKTLEGVTEAINAETDALKKQAAAERTSAEQANISAKNKLENVVAIRERTVALLKEADAEFELQAHMAGGDPSGGQAVAKAAADRQVVKDALAKAEADLKQERINVEKTRVDLAEEEAKRMADPIARINKLYDDKAKAAKDAARKEADAGKHVTSVLTDQLAVIEKARKAALDAQRDADKASHFSNRETGRELTPEEAASIARGAGLQVNSVSRTYGRQKQLYDEWVAKGRPADNPVAPPGTSAHEGAKGRWALDIQFGAGVTPELLRKVFAAQGVNLTKVFKERGHFHVEGSRSQADAGTAADDKAAEEAIRRQKAYEDQLAQVEGNILAAKRANVTDLDQIAAFDKDRIAVEQAKAEADIVAKVQLGEYSDLQGKVLIEKQRQLAAERIQTIDTEVLARHLADAVDMALMESQNQSDLLNAQLGLATTIAGRRDLAMAMLDEEEKQARIKAQETLDLYAIGQATKKQADEARAALQQLDRLHPLKVEAINRQNQGALGKYLQDTDPKTINDRVETLVTNELTQVRDGINDAITNALGVKDPMLKGLLEIFLDQVIFRPIAEALQKHSGKNGDGGFGSLFGSLFGGGKAANDNALTGVNSAALTTNTTALGVSTTALAAFTTALAAASAAAGASGASSLGGGLSSLLGGLGSAFGGGGVGEYGGVIMENPFVTGGFAAGTDDLPRGLSWVGENGRELLFNGGGGRISVLNNQQSRQVAQPAFAGGGGGGLTVINQFNSPQPGNPRRIGAVVGRSAQLGAARAARKGLAAPRGR